MSSSITAIFGYLADAPEVRSTQNGHTVANFTIPVSRKWDEDKEATEWNRCVAWDVLAERVQEAQKGWLIAVLGRLQTRKWKDRQGSDRYTTEIVCEELICSPRSVAGNSRNNSPGNKGQVRQNRQERLQRQKQKDFVQEDEFNDDISF